MKTLDKPVQYMLKIYVNNISIKRKESRQTDLACFTEFVKNETLLVYDYPFRI